MKTKIIFLSTLLILCSSITLVSVLEKLGLNENLTQNYILSNVTGSFRSEPIDVSSKEEFPDETKEFKLPYAKLLSSLSPEDQKTVATELCQYVKNYVSSDAFKMAYAAARESAKPESEPMAMDAATKEMMKKSVVDAKKQVATLKANKMVSADNIKQFEQSIAEMEQQIQDNSDPTPNNTEWTKRFPENPNKAIKARLEEYLKLAATVDFNAPTSGTGKRKKFTDPALEKKSLKWKAIYRAGKDVNTIATNFAKTWLTELK